MLPSVLNDSQFKLIVSLSLILLLFLAVLSTIQCQHKRLEGELKENFAGSSEMSKVNVVSATLSTFLHRMLSDSFPIKRYFGNGLLVTDVAVMLPLDLVYRRSYKDATLASPANVADVDLSKITLDMITCPEHSQRYLPNDSSHCSGVMQALESSSQFSCVVRVAEAYYRIRSVCMNVICGSSTNVIRATPSLPGGLTLYLLQPFAIHDGNQVSPVSMISVNNNQVTVEGGMTLSKTGGPQSIVAYYLDYVRPSPDFMQNWIVAGPTKRAPKVSSYINVAGSYAFINQHRAAYRAGFVGEFDARVNDGTPPAPVNYMTDGFIPGMPNLAKLAVKFGHIPKANKIESMEIDISAEGCIAKNLCTPCKTVPTEQSLSAFACTGSTQNLPSNVCFSGFSK